MAASVTHGLQAPQQAVGAALLHRFMTPVSLYVMRSSIPGSLRALALTSKQPAKEPVIVDLCECGYVVETDSPTSIEAPGEKIALISNVPTR